MAYLYCSRCTNRYPEPSTRWLCDCGSLLDLSGPASFPRLPLASRPPGLWRYREALAFSFQTEPVSLGEPMTPLIRPDPKFPHLFFKLEFLFPTGSFKDRGSAVLISKVKELGIPFVIEDSSGNAGASIAAYCARAGVACRIFVPAQTSPGKLTQIQAYGAQLVKVEGTREHTAQVAREAAQEGYYASHSCNPYFCEGTKTFAFEIWEQMGGKAPDLLILPVGNGTLLLGTFLGFSQLMQAGEIEELPRIIGVQSQRCLDVTDVEFGRLVLTHHGSVRRRRCAGRLLGGWRGAAFVWRGATRNERVQQRYGKRSHSHSHHAGDS